MFEDVLTPDKLHHDYVENGLTKAEIARKYSTTVATINKYMKAGGIKRNPSWAYRSEDLSGKKFGRLRCLRPGTTDRHSKLSWVCKCKCGNEKEIAAASLKRGLTSSCGCYKRDLVRNNGYKDISASFWRRKEKEAANRGIEFSITKEDVWEIFERQNMLCAYTGVSISFSPDSNKPQQATASIDRIDSFKGYTKDNIQIVHKAVNLCKSWLPEDEFVAMCNLVAQKRNMKYEDCVSRMSRTVYRKIRPGS